MRRDFNPGDVRPDGRPPASATLFDPATDGPWRGFVDGSSIGGPVTVLTYGTDEVGAGPRLHVHPYDETFIVVEGRGRFFVGEEILDASAGQLVLGPAGVPHRFENLGPGRLQTIDIHHSPSWIQADLDWPTSPSTADTEGAHPNPTAPPRPVVGSSLRSGSVL